MSKIKKRAFYVLIIACVLCATAIFLLPTVKASADTADVVAAQKSRNENLVVKYSLDDTSTGGGAKLTGYKWDSVSQTFVADPAAAATVQNHVNNAYTGTVTSESGVEGSGALKFTGKAHAYANFHLPANATGMTVSMWAKNLNSYWASLVEFWDGSNGGRFGKGTMQGNGGRSNVADPWSANCAAHNAATIAPGGGWDSFVINANSSDKGGSAADPMVANRWYQLTYTVTETEMRAYRDGVLKQIFSNKDYAPTILQSIMKAAKSSNGKLGIRLSHDTNDGDILDDFRIYNGVMSSDEVAELCNEYNGIKAIGDKSVKIDGNNTEYKINNGNNVKFSSAETTFPKILLGGVAATAVTENNGTYSASGSGFSYSYTVGERSVSECVATVTYTAGGVNYMFTVTQVDPTVIRSLTVVGGISEVTLMATDFTVGAVEIEVDSLEEFSLTLNAVLDELAVIEGASDGELTFTAADLVDGKYTFTVKSGNAQRRYTLEPKIYSANVALTELTFGSYTLSPAFDAATTEYTVTLLKGEGNAAFKAINYTVADSKATAEKRYNITDGVITVTVTAENKRDIRVYTVALTEIDTDATLREITVGGEAISDFSADKTEYIYKYSGDIPEVAAFANSATASVTVGKVADGKVTVTVTAGDGNEKTYTVKLVAKSSDTSITSLKVNGIAAKLNGETGTVELSVGSGLADITVVAKVAEGASYTYEVEGETLKVTVTAEDGTEKVYSVAVTVSDRVILSQPSASGTVTDETVKVDGCGSSLSAASFYAALALIIAAAFMGMLKKKRKHKN